VIPLDRGSSHQHSASRPAPPLTAHPSLQLVIDVRLPSAPELAAAVTERLRSLVREVTAEVASLPGAEATLHGAYPAVGPALVRPAGGPALELDREARTVRVAGRTAPLTRLEFDLLATLARRPGRTFTRAVLLSAVWGESVLVGSGRTVDVHTFRLRTKLGPEGRHLVTVRGIGYRWDGPPL
jgi:DNA-binding response OmpR family regulator